MKKALLSILAGATMLSSTAFAIDTIDASKLVLPTGDQTISDLYSNTQNGINNNNLSEYEQAWMIVHDKNSLFKHKTFWTRTGTTFVPHSVDKLGKLNSSDRSKMIKSNIIEASIIDSLNKTIEKLTIAKEEAIMNFTTVNGKLEDKIAHVKDLDKKISDLTTTAEEVKAALNEAIANGAQLVVEATEEGRKVGFQQATDKAKSAGKATGAEFGEYASVQTVINAVYTNGKKEGILSVTTEVFDALAPGGIDKAAKINEGKKRVATTAADAKRSTSDIAVTEVWGQTQVFVTINDKVITSTNLPNGELMSILEFVSEKSFDAGYSEGFADGYDTGFSDGYDAGYADGYADGFTDGVNSVK